MATAVYINHGLAELWSTHGGGGDGFSVKDASRAITDGADTFRACMGGGNNRAPRRFTETIGTGTGVAISMATIAGTTTGKILLDSSGPATNYTVFFSRPLAADVTISGQMTFNICALESSMSANATVGVSVYRVDSQGALTLIVRSSFGTELTTSLARKTWNATPTSTDMKVGDRFLCLLWIDDAGAVTMASGFTVTFQMGGSNANTADSNVTFNENLTFLTTAPTGTRYYLRATDSGKGVGFQAILMLSTTQGSGTEEYQHTTATGPHTFPGVWFNDQGAGVGAVEWITPQLNAFTLEGLVECQMGVPASSGFEASTTPFDSLTIEIAIVDDDLQNPVIWARGYCAQNALTTGIRYLSGPSTSVAQGKRLRLRFYSDDWLGHSGSDTQVSGTTHTLRLDGTSTYDSHVRFTQTITEAKPALPIPRRDAGPFMIPVM